MKKKLLTEAMRISKEKNRPGNHPRWGTGKQHFTFIIQDNKILEWGVNRDGDALIQFGYSEFSDIHSETDAYRKAKGIIDKAKGFDVINVRLNNQNDVRLSRPCPCCMNFLKSLGANQIWYTTLDGFEKVK